MQDLGGMWENRKRLEWPQWEGGDGIEEARQSAKLCLGFAVRAAESRPLGPQVRGASGMKR